MGLVNKVAAAENQKSCAKFRISLQDVLAQIKDIERKDTPFNEAEAKTAKLLGDAVGNPDCLFNDLSDREAFSLIKGLSRLEDKFGEGKDPKQISLWDLYIKHYPRSAHVDEARWQRTKTAAAPYEYEGSADAALLQIEAIEAFIKAYPVNSCLAEAKLELARVYRIAYETFRYGEGLSTASNNSQQTIGQGYRNRARLLLQHLCNQSPDRVRRDSCRALKDLQAGRCVYMGPGSPNPDIPDHWALPKPK